MFSFHRFGRLDVFALFAVSCLCAMFLLISCEDASSDVFVDNHLLNGALIGTWVDSAAGDSYTITANHLSYGYGGDFISYAGTIVYVSNFTHNAGVIIIKYDADHKASYWEYDADWNPVAELPLRGDFVGVYYKNLTPGFVQIGGAYVDGGAEKATLVEAMKAFTMGNEGTYMTWYGTYTK